MIQYIMEKKRSITEEIFFQVLLTLANDDLDEEYDEEDL